MENEVDSLTLMVQELLELSRIESGKVPLQLQPTSPGDVLSSAAERLRLQAERANLRLETSVSTDLPMVMADPPRLEQVLVNLLHHALKFTPAGGRVFIEVSQDEPSRVRILVRDTGFGIPPDKLEAVFEPFVQLDTSRTRTASGTGLGLAISRDLARGMGGELSVESTLGGRST